MDLTHQINEHGFAFRRQALNAVQLSGLLQSPESTASSTGVRRRGGETYAARNLLWDIPGLAAALKHAGMERLAAEALGKPAFPINAIWFDKTPDANWKVPPHQDLMMPVERKVDEPGFSGWSTKLGVVYVEPPADVLFRLVALRIHFDPCPCENGALAVVPASHLRGKLSDRDILTFAPTDFVFCEAEAGDILLMNPLLVHRSSPARLPTRRRVLHVIYATEEPGFELRWKRGPWSERFSHLKLP